MNNETLSNKLNRIKEATNSIRATIGVESDVIEEVATATSAKIVSLNSELNIKEEALAEKSAELEEFQNNMVGVIQEEVEKATKVLHEDIAEKTEALNLKEAELQEAISSREAAITTAVNDVKRSITAYKVADTTTMEAKTDMKEDDVCAVVDIQKGYPQQGASAKGALFNSVVTLDRPFAEWYDQFTAQLDMVGETEVFLSLRSEDDTCDLMLQFGRWSDQAYLQMYFYDHTTQDSLSADFMIEDLYATTIRAEYAQLRQGGKDTSWAGTSVFMNFSQPLFNSMEQHPDNWLDPFIFFVSQEYNGTYRYSELEGGWVKIPVGMNLEPTKVLQGVEYLTDDGTVTGTFGTDLGSTDQFPTFAEFLDGIPSTGWEPSGYSSATELMNLLHANREGWNPLVHCINWHSSKLNGYSSASANLFQKVKVDEFSFDKIPGSYFNKPSTLYQWFAGCSIDKIDFSALDISELKGIQNPYSGVKYSQIKDWLSEEKTFEVLTGFNSSGVLSGIIHDLDDSVPLAIKNRTYKGVDLFMSCFRNIQSKHLLLENLVFEKKITRYDNMFASNTKLESICIRNVDVTFQVGTSGSFFYSAAKNMFYGCTALKYLIIDNPTLLNFPAHHPYTYKPTSQVLYCNSSLEDTPVYTEGAIFVPDNLVSSYKSHTMWSYFSSRIKPISEMPADLKQIHGYTE